MHNNDWTKLITSNTSYKYEPRAVVEKGQCTTKSAFTQIAFDDDEESLIAVDIKEFLYYIELSESPPCCKRLEKVGQASFLAFNPIYKEEILIGLVTGDIKILKLYPNIEEFCLFSGHKLAPTHISFYKNHCLTSSQNEVIIWHLQSYSRVHQLKICMTNAAIKKTAFSSMGHVVVLYRNDIMQIWMFGQLDKDIKIDAQAFGTCYIKDFTFTKDGKTMVMAGTRKISVINTYDWSLLKHLSLPKNFFNVKQLSVISCSLNCKLNCKVNKIIVFLSSKCTLHFFDTSISNFLKTSDVISGIKKFALSSTSKYIAYIDQEGCLNIAHVDKIILEECRQPKRLPELQRLKAHAISDHLECIKWNIRRELDMKRLMPILQEFGEYPEKYRALIWSTILKLPANRAAYIALASEVTRRKFALNTLRDCSLADRNKASLLIMTMDCLIQWCPLLIQSPFLPKLIFPFLVIFQKDPLLAFELILSILLNYCQKWFEYHPLPPLNILGIVENILLEADPMLLNIFYQNGITTTEYAWPLLQTAMSEVLLANEWSILWDHLISFQRPSLLLMCVVAYSIYSKENIISLIKSSGDITEFYSSQGHVRAKDLLMIAKRLDQETSERTHPNRYLRNKILQLNRTGPYFLFISEEYPKFLTEKFTDLEKLQAQSKECNYNRKLSEFAEKKRLQQETEAFAKEIHKTRLNEAQKYFQEHVNNLDCTLKNLSDEKNPDSQENKMTQQYKSVKSESKILNSGSNESNNYEKLQRDVTKLEYEVQNFLDSLR